MNKKLFVSTVSTIVLMNSAVLADATVTNWDELLKATQNGGTITLGGDISDVKEQAYTPSNSNVISIGGVVIDGDGYTLSAPKDNGALYATYSFIENKYTGSDALILKNINFNGGYKITADDRDSEGGGAIHNKKARIGDITANFSNNYAKSTAGSMGGGAITNFSDSASIGNISGIFTGNYVNAKSQAYGGAIYNQGSSASIGDITGEFNGNYTNGASAQGGAIYNHYSNIGDTDGIDGIDATFQNNKAIGTTGHIQGGAIYNNYGNIGNIKGSFINNSAEGGEVAGGAIYNSTVSSSVIGSIKADFSGNNALGQTTTRSGAIYNGGKIDVISGNFVDNHAKSLTTYSEGGAIYNNGTIGEISGVFENNSSEGATGGYGGAIFSNQNITIVARDANTTKFSGNYVITNDEKTYNAIYLASRTATLYFKASDSGTIILDDEIESYGLLNGQYAKIEITGDTTGRIEFNNAVKKFGSLSSSDVTIALGTSDYGTADFAGVAVSMTGGALDMKNDAIQVINMDSFTATGNIGISLDADMEQGKADKIVTTNAASGSFNISSINVISDILKGYKETQLQIVESLSGDINIEFVNASDYVAYSNKYKYEFTDNQDGSLNVTATRNIVGLNGAVADDEAADKSYSIDGSGDDVVRDLGQLEGDNFVIQGNGNELDGNGFAGMIVDEGQNVGVNNVKSVTGFDSKDDGGFIKNSGTLTVENSSFENNHSDGNGGAIWSDGTVNVVASDGNDHKFSGNTTADDDNAIYMDGGELNLQASNGSLTFDDTIDGADYTLNIGGSSTGDINFNNTVSGADAINIKGGNVNLAEDNLFDGNNINLQGGILHLDNGTLGEASFAELNGGDGQLHFDVNTVDKTSDIIKVGNLNGKVNVVAVNIGGDDKEAVAGRDDNKIKFAEVSGENNGSFNILRVMNSAYRWGTSSEEGEGGIINWLMDVKNEVVAEVTAYLGLHTAGVEQTRDMLRNVEEKSFSGRYRMPLQNGYCNSPACYLYNVWVAPIYSSSRVKSPVNMDADVKGLEFGGDVQQDKRNRVGLFASFRQGDYDLDGNSDYWTADTSSKIDMDSYILGAYYRYVNNNWWFTGDVYAGLLKADIKTADGVNASSDGYQFGGAATLGYDFWLQRDVSLSPLVRLGYMMQSWDDVKDNYGKTAKYDTLSQVELEIGAKLQKVWGNSHNQPVFNAWVMPSIIQTVVSGSDVNITDLQKVKTVDNGTLGRLAGGVNYYFAKSWNIYGSASYTFGSDYNNKEILAGVNYAF